MASDTSYSFQTLRVSRPAEYVVHVELNRPEKMNAMNRVFWKEILDCFNQLAVDKDCRCVVLSARGRIFTAGLDLNTLIETGSNMDMEAEPARRAPAIKHTIEHLQQSFTAIEKCPKPVIVAVHSACVGGGVDLITACDVRMCTQDAWFQVKEVDVGVIADVGTLQRLPKVVGSESLVRELCFSARKMGSEEAKQCGLVSSVYESKEKMISAAMNLATEIASKSPVAVQGTKINLVYSRDHSVPESLHFVAVWNQLMAQSEDLVIASSAFFQKQKPTFSKL